MELTAELLADAAELLDTVISPDGRLVAYVVSTADDSSSRDRLRALWVAPADGSSAPRRLAAGPELAGVPRWAPDSASLVFISGGQLHRIGLDGGQPLQLTSWRGEITGHLPLADGRVAVIATDEPDAGQERRRAEGDDAIVWTRWGPDAPRNRLHLLDVAGRDLTRVAALGDRHVLEVVQRPDGGPLAVLSWACPADEPGAFTAELHVVDPQAASPEPSTRIMQRVPTIVGKM